MSESAETLSEEEMAILRFGSREQVESIITNRTAALLARLTQAETERDEAQQRAVTAQRTIDATFGKYLALRARLEAVEKERDDFKALALEDTKRRGEVIEERDALRDGIRALADEIEAGTLAFGEDWGAAAQGISTRLSGEAAAMIVQTRAEMRWHVLALLASHPDKDADDE